MVHQYFKRFIIIDHQNKKILIQVMWDQSGDAARKEYSMIEAGMFWEFIPKDMVTQIRETIASGYKPVSTYIDGWQNDDTVMFQIIDMKTKLGVPGGSPIAAD